MKQDCKDVLSKVRKDFSDQLVDGWVKQVEAPLPDDNEIKRVEIIILKYKSPEIEKECLQRIIDHTSHPYKLTFFDNRPNGANMSKAWNKLIKESTCELVVVMDSDAFVTDGWLEELVKAMDIQDCAIAAPVLDKSVGAQVQRIPKSTLEPFFTNNHITGCCFITRKNIIEELGWFDEDFLVFGQDSDMNEKIINHPFYKVYVVPSSLVYHGKIEDTVYIASYSTRKAADDREYSYHVDVNYAPVLIKKRSDGDYYKTHEWKKS